MRENHLGEIFLSLSLSTLETFFFFSFVSFVLLYCQYTGSCHQVICVCVCVFTILAGKIVEKKANGKCNFLCAPELSCRCNTIDKLTTWKSPLAMSTRKYCSNIMIRWKIIHKSKINKKKKMTKTIIYFKYSVYFYLSFISPDFFVYLLKILFYFLLNEKLFL